MTKLVLATRNPHKTREFAEILGSEFAVSDLSGISNAPVVEETGRTFEENALLKALAVSRVVDELVVADDSGLEVNALDGAPGIYSARYAGEDAEDAANVAKVLHELANMPDRRARFRCVIAVAQKGKELAIMRGSVDGQITIVPRGIHGFGYDPVFMPEGFKETFGQLGHAVKSKISHRARAIAQLRDWLREFHAA